MIARALLLASLAAPPAAAQGHAALRDEEKEAFLLQAEVVRTRSAPGATGSLRATLRRGDLTHDAHIQPIDAARPEPPLASGIELDYRDGSRNDVAAYRLDRLLGLGMVPVTVLRPFDNHRSAFIWSVDSVQMTERERRERSVKAPDLERWNRQVDVARTFDQLIHNVDRSPGNVVIDGSWRLWMLDHSRAFKVGAELPDEKALPERFPRDLLAGLRKLDQPTLVTRLGGLVGRGQIAGLLQRRDRIVAHFDRLIAERGEPRVLYDLPVGERRPAPTARPGSGDPQ